MRFILMHRTAPPWEAGVPPGPELIARVGALMGELIKAGVFVGAEGLRASSHGVRLTFTGGKRRITPGPFTAAEVPASSFLILRVASLDEAIDWSTRVGQVIGDVRIELRPVTEPWDIGMAPRPLELTTQRVMALLHDPAAETGNALSPEREELRARVVDQMTKAGVLIATVAMQPTAKGARLRRDGQRLAVIDGPFVESKELIAGYAIVDAPSKPHALEWAHRYATAVDADEVDLRALG
ncbi:YciI family protein [Myxococcaceae bacterium GXIMD 01537]